MVQQKQRLEQLQEQDSIWYFEKGEFRELIQGFGDETVTVELLLKGMSLRELHCLSKTFRKMTVGQVAADPSLIKQLYDELRAGMPPPTKFKLPYKKAARELELKQVLAESYDIDIEKAKARVITGCYNGDKVVFPYAIEAVIAPREDWRRKYKYQPGDLEFIGYINDSPAIDGGEKYFEDAAYSWESKSERGSYGSPKTMIATSAREILHKCGFGDDIYKSRRRWPSVFLINLKTNVRQWRGSAGKTHINLAPFAKDIAQVVSWLAYQIPTCHGMGFAIDTYSGEGRDESQIAKNYLKDFLIKRRKAVEADQYLKIKDRITQSGVWYRIRPDMKEKDFEPLESWTQTRRTLQGEIEKVIGELWPNENLTREDLGIVAASKGAVFYDGEQWPINGDSVDALAEKGVAIIVIEKEGVADVLAPYARKYGIALAHTGGRFTKAIIRMIERAKKAGSVVRILTDYDAVGVDIAAATITPTIRIGIERDIITWLQQNGFPDLTEEDVEEEYEPSGTSIAITDPYLKTKRIELDSIQEKVGAEKLWEYIMYRLQLPDFNLGFDYTKVIEMPPTQELRPEIIKRILTAVDAYLAKITEKKEEAIEKKLAKSKKLIEIVEKQNEIQNELLDRIEKVREREDKGLLTIITGFKELLPSLPKPDNYQETDDDENNDDESKPSASEQKPPDPLNPL